MRILKWFLAFLFLALVMIAQAETPQRLFQKANEAYQQKDYSTAISAYEDLVKEGVQSKEVHYNLGNAYYRSNRLGKAILNYERALVLKPSDADVQYNLQIAELDRKDDFGEIPEFFLTRAWDWTSQLWSSSIWSAVAILLVWLGIGGIVLWMMSKERRRRKQGFLWGTLALLIAVLPFFLAKTSARLEQNSGQAIIIKSKTSIHNNADDTSAILYELHEGTKVKLLDSIGDWKKVRLSNGEQGWVIQAALEQI